MRFFTVGHPYPLRPLVAVVAPELFIGVSEGDFFGGNFFLSPVTLYRLGKLGIFNITADNTH